MKSNEKGVLEEKGGKTTVATWTIYIRDNWWKRKGVACMRRIIVYWKENWIFIAIDFFISMDDEFSLVYFLSNWISRVTFRIL